jgi:glutaredoxin
LCVLCRRQRADFTPPLSAAPPARETSPLKSIALGALLVLGAAGAGLALRFTTDDQIPLQPSAASARLPEVAPEPSAEQRALDKAKAADLAASLAMLDRAEAERIQKQQLAAAQSEQQRQAAQAARDQEQRERDRARHEAVTRDLDLQAFRKQRGDVQITLYGTDWCGVCERARKYMRDKHIPFKDFDIEQDQQARQRAHALNPQGSVPTITIDKQLLIGFSPESLEAQIAKAARARKL